MLSAYQPMNATKQFSELLVKETKLIINFKMEAHHLSRFDEQ